MMSSGGYTNENDIIAEEAYVRGYLDRVANYVTTPRRDCGAQHEVR